MAVETSWVKFQTETPEENKNSFKNDRGGEKQWQNLYTNLYRGCSIPTPLFVQNGLTVRKLVILQSEGKFFTERAR